MAAQPDATTPAQQGQIKSAERVLDIIETLAARRRLPQSSLHCILAVLTARGYVARNSKRQTYGLGIRVWEAGQAYLRHRDLVREAFPVMEEFVGLGSGTPTRSGR